MNVLLAAAAMTAAKKAEQPAGAGAPWTQSLPFSGQWPGQMDLLDWAQKMSPGIATLLILLGIVYLIFGFYLYKGLIVVNAGIAGAWLGAMIGEKSGSAVPCAVLGAFIAAAITFPMMKWAVALLGGLLGAVLGGGVWRMLDGDPRFAWAGAAMGLIACGLFCFILFNASVMTYMSLQGSLMLVFGILGLLYKYQDLGPKLTLGLQQRHFILPMAIFIPTVIGLLYQQASNRAAEPAPAKK